MLPKGPVRIRHFDWMAYRCRSQRAAPCRALLREGGTPAMRPANASIEMIVPRELLRCPGEAQDVNSIRPGGTFPWLVTRARARMSDVRPTPHPARM